MSSHFFMKQNFNCFKLRSPFLHLFFKLDNSKSYLKCYVRQYPDLLNPVYIEEVHRNPKVVVLRNVINDAELDFIREESQDKVSSLASTTIHLLDTKTMHILCQVKFKICLSKQCSVMLYYLGAEIHLI